MKRSLFAIIGATVLILAGCIKNEEKLYTGNLAEIDATSWNANFNATDILYPLMTRIPKLNFVSGTGDSVLRRYSGTFRLRINLIGAPSKSEQTVGYKVFGSPLVSPTDSVAIPATITGQTPALPSIAKVKVLNAVAGTHFSALSGTATIPADSSYGYITIQILNPGSSPDARFLGIQLDSSGSVKPAVNYNRIGLIIDQR
jgi:hypothetical protein